MTLDESGEFCGNCRFAECVGNCDDERHFVKIYECRKRAPVAVPCSNHPGIESRWPQVEWWQWCGEFTPRRAEY